MYYYYIYATDEEVCLNRLQLAEVRVPKRQRQDLAVGSPTLCPSSQLLRKATKRDNLISRWCDWPNPPCAFFHVEEMSVEDQQNNLPISGLKGSSVSFLQNHKTSTWDRIIIAIFYHMRRGSMSSRRKADEQSTICSNIFCTAVQHSQMQDHRNKAPWY